MLTTLRSPSIKRSTGFFQQETSSSSAEPHTTAAEDMEDFVQQETVLQEKIKLQLTTLFSRAFSNLSSTYEKKLVKPHIERLPAQLIEHNLSIKAFIQEYYATITDLKASLAEKKRHIFLCKRELISAVQLTIRTILKKIADTSHLNSYLNAYDFSTVLHVGAVPVEQSSKLQTADLRVYYASERLQRRRDSLSRLFDMDSDKSVCSAVTIVNGELIIAANCSSNEFSTEIAEALYNKLLIVRAVLEQASANPSLMNHAFYINVVEQLRAQGGVSLPDFIMIQAVFKTIQATILTASIDQVGNDSYFTADDIDTLLYSSTFTILVPAKNRKSFVLSVFNGEPSFNSKASDEATPFVPFPASGKHHTINHFHAEQLIAYYLTRVKRLDLNDHTTTPLVRIGVTKLCCKTCAILNNLACVQVRGSSQMSFPGTVNLFEDMISAPLLPEAAINLSSPQPTARTYPKRSPWTTELSARQPTQSDKRPRVMTEESQSYCDFIRVDDSTQAPVGHNSLFGSRAVSCADANDRDITFNVLGVNNPSMI